MVQDANAVPLARLTGIRPGPHDWRPEDVRYAPPRRSEIERRIAGEDPNPREDPGMRIAPPERSEPEDTNRGPHLPVNERFGQVLLSGRIILPREQLEWTDEMMTNLQILAMDNSEDVREMLELAQEMRTFARQMTMLADFMVRNAERIIERQMRHEARRSSTD